VSVKFGLLAAGAARGACPLHEFRNSSYNNCHHSLEEQKSGISSWQEKQHSDDDNNNTKVGLCRKLGLLNKNKFQHGNCKMAVTQTRKIY
jgi:hypothetical protein